MAQGVKSGLNGRSCQRCRIRKNIKDFINYNIKNRVCIQCKNEIVQWQCGFELTDGHKKCRKCLLIKSADCFSRNSKKADFLSEKCKDCYKQYWNKYYSDINNKKFVINRSKDYRKENYEKVTKYNNAYKAEKRKIDVNFKIASNLRSRLSHAIKNGRAGSAVKDLSCTVEDLKIWLSIFFYDNPLTGEPMTWDNYGRNGWHIDHIRPLASFDLTNKEQVLVACCFTNLQPLWHHENESKGARWIAP